MATTPDYPILGPPRISAAGFAAVLAGAGSPSASVAAACYQAFVSQGVDPAVGLAVFRKESTYGKYGRAARNRSWGNIRGASAGYPLDSGNFRIYPTWTAGAGDCARLLAIYGRNQIRPGVNTSTVQTFPYVWAPSSDGNAPDRYGDQLVSWITAWSRQYPGSGSGAPGVVTPPTAQPIVADPGSCSWSSALGKSCDAALTREDLAKVADTVAQIPLIFPGLPFPVPVPIPGNPVQGTLVDQLVREGYLGRAVRSLDEKYARPGWTQGPLDPIVSGLIGAGSVLANGIAGALTNVALLAAILGVIILSLYRIAKA